MGKEADGDRWWSLEHVAEGHYRMVEISAGSMKTVIEFTSLDEVEELLQQCSRDAERIRYKEGG